MLWPSPNPLGSEEFGGVPAEMKSAHAYRKALAEFRTRHRVVTDEPEDEEKPKGDGGRKSEPKGRGEGAKAKADEREQCL